MNTPSFKDILEKLSVFKNNLSLLVPIVIGLVGVLMFIPTQLLSSSLKARIQRESLSTGRNLQTQSRNPVALDQWEELAKQQQLHENDANQIAELSRQTTQRELLSYAIFPSPNDTSPLIFKRFGERYRDELEKILVRVDANNCPSKVELDEALKSEAGRSLSGGGRYPGSYLFGEPQVYGLAGTGAYNEVQSTIVDELCLGRAKSCLVYASPDDLAGYLFWAGYKLDVKVEDAVRDCWYHQLAFWVIEDVFETVSAMNSGHQNLLEAPVKRVSSVSFTIGPKKSVLSPLGMRSQSQRDQGDRPVYVVSPSDGLTESCTGRLCGEDVDVIHFELVVIVGSKDVLRFMNELCSGKEHRFYGFFNELPRAQAYKHNQITILESHISSINPDDRTHRLYRYGDAPVSELEVICEYVLNRQGYDVIKPESVKKTLQGEEAQ